MADKNLEWRCSECGKKVLGVLDKNGEVLRIKIRDEYLWIEGGSITRTCSKCGSLNRLDQRSSEQQIKIMKKEV